MNKINSVFICLIILIGYSIQAQNSSKNDHKIEKEIDSILKLMTLEEKIGQMTMYNGSWDLTGPPGTVSAKDKFEKLKNGKIGAMLNVTSAEATREAQKAVMEHTRLKIPLVFGYDVIHGYKTIFPIPLGESASWDLELMEKSASIAAKEASAAGIHWTFAPMIDVSRDARWGRVMEGAGEDPYYNSVVGVARIKGFQGDDLSASHTIAACAKHFAGYGFAEAGKDYNSVDIGVYELHNSILPPFKAAADANVATFMNAFNEIDGIPATAHKYLQRDVLKDGWNWEGLMVSDWGSIGEMIAHGYARDKTHAGELAIKGGSDMDMESSAYEIGLKNLVEENKVSMDLVDDAVKRVLRLKMKLGLFKDPYKYSNLDREESEIYTAAHQEIAREAGRKSIVLLKNDTILNNNSSLLPLKPNQKIAIIGDLADDKDTPLGNWRAKAERKSAVSLLEGIKNAIAPENITFAQGPAFVIDELEEGKRQFLWPLKFNESDTSGTADALKIASHADVVIVVMGENAYQTGEGRSQVDIQINKLQKDFLKKVRKANPNTVLVLMNGRPLDLSWESENISTILETWHLGSQAGNAIADVLFGKYNPSGKLPISFPRSVGQEPLFYNQKNTGRPYSQNTVTFSGYTDSEKTALYPFGFGLSYTSFKYDKLKLSDTTMTKNGKILASIEVTNIGDKDGEEVVQLYIRDLIGSLTRPVKELKGFKKLMIKKGETKTVSFEITKDQLEFYTVDKIWDVEPGNFQLGIGGDSQIKLGAKFQVN
ncbi:beta-glucosidase BglX [Gramella sp. AN32]|uniref:beta-glucosidase n=1 Tax=Christiangramia antarctica TaxID=2058158 RepID=A0ABW5X596_9FLAO|nr:beta-glucosidase BglX [Gramella sp. AN32]MCM4158114.1 beta-glucosidase BglX [Gramella sp. AN32]